jgi:Malectin domain/zinc-ribbon domain
VIRCPNCGASVSPGVSMCPVCNQMLIGSDAPTQLNFQPTAEFQPISDVPGVPPSWPDPIGSSSSAARGNPHWKIWMAISLIGGSILIASITAVALAASNKQSPGPGSIPGVVSTRTSLVTPTVMPTLTPTTISHTTIALNCGGPQIGTFAGDTHFNGGAPFSTNESVDLDRVNMPAQMQVYQSVRAGDFTYMIPNLPPGHTYTIRLHFAELFVAKSGQRQFNVSINGNRVLHNFDIVATAGGPRRAIVREFTVQANSNGQIEIAFQHSKADAICNAIEVMAA